MRKLFINGSIILFLSILVIGFYYPTIFWSYVIVIPLIITGLIDIFQDKQTITRNYPNSWQNSLLNGDFVPKVLSVFC